MLLKRDARQWILPRRGELDIVTVRVPTEKRRNSPQGS